MGSTIVFMMRRVHLSNDDLQLIEWAWRGQANQYRKDAERQPNPTVRDKALDTAQRYERLSSVTDSANDGCWPRS